MGLVAQGRGTGHSEFKAAHTDTTMKRTLAYRRSSAPYVSPVFKNYIIIDFYWLGATII